MLERVYVGLQSVDDHAALAGVDRIAELRSLAAPLRGLRVLNLSATPYGGGVAEMLRSEVALLRDLGIDATWQLIHGDEQFFRVTKLIHNGLQGGGRDLTRSERREYLGHAKQNAAEIADDYDVVVVHDPQPLPVRAYHDSFKSRWVWRCHIDTSAPRPHIWELARPFVCAYDLVVFTARQFVPPDMLGVEVRLIPPAIDPLSPKNIDIAPELARRVVSWIGLDVTRPLMAQVSRFDRWKDPFGVIEVFRTVRQTHPDLQLAMIGSMALDDPEGWDIHRRLEEEARRQPDLHVFTNLVGVGNIEVNAVQRLADVIIQRSVREGFGLVVSEAMWKCTPVVATHAGGIPLQMSTGVGGFLADSTAQAADRVNWLLANPGEAAAIAERGRERVRERFLLTRLIADDLELYRHACKPAAA